jgi:hypothetical protein
MGKNKNGKKAIGNEVDTTNSKIHYPIWYKIFLIVILALTSIPLFYAPLFRGLYFVQERLPNQIFIFGIFTIFIIGKTIVNDKRLIKTKLDYVSIGLLIIYTITLIVAVNKRHAVLEMLKYWSFFALYLIITHVAYTFKSKLAIIWVIIASSVSVSIISLDGALENITNNWMEKFSQYAINIGIDKTSPIIKFVETVINMNNKYNGEGPISSILNASLERLGFGQPFFDIFINDRIYSTLQYANAFAAYSIAMYFLTISIIIIGKKYIHKILAGVAAFVLLTAFIYTQSRGVMLIAFVATIAYITLLPKGIRIYGAFYNILMWGTSILLMNLGLSRYMIAPSGNELKIIFLIILGIGIIKLATIPTKLLVDKITDKVPEFVYRYLIYGLGTVFILFIIVAFNYTEPLMLTKSNSRNTMPIVQRNIFLQGGKDYKLQMKYNVKAPNNSDYTFKVKLISKTEEQVLLAMSQDEILDKEINGKAKENIISDIDFSIPEGSINTNLAILNFDSNHTIVINEANIYEKSNNQLVKELNLKYKFIPDSLVFKFGNLMNSKSIIERLTFFKDGSKMFLDRWFIGAGAGAWNTLYFAYQSYLYWSTQAHTYFLQIALEAGIIGIIIYISLIWALLQKFIMMKKSKDNDTNSLREQIIQTGLFVGISILLVHTFIDFDFSITAVFMVFWVLLGLFNSTEWNKELNIQNTNKISLRETILDFWNLKNKSIKSLNLYPIVLIIPSIVLIVMASQIYSGLKYEVLARNQLAKYASSSGKYQNYKMGVDYYKRALENDKTNLGYIDKYVELILKDPDSTKEELKYVKELIMDSRSMAMYSPEYSGKMAIQLFKFGKIDEALELSEVAPTLRPLKEDGWERLTAIYASTLKRYYNSKNNSKAKEINDKIINIVNLVKKYNSKNKFPFKLNHDAMEFIERSMFLDQDFEYNKSYENVVFFGVPGFDLNLDGLLDQYSIKEKDNLKLTEENYLEVIANEKVKYFDTRTIYFQGNKTYRIEIRLKEGLNVPNIRFDILGMYNNKKLELSDGRYIQTIVFPEKISVKGYPVRIYLSEDITIKSYIIEELID